MPCYHPLRAYRKVGAYDPVSGKWPLTFKRSEGWIESALDVPCGKCVGCRLDYARSWAVRCMHEAKLHSSNCVITLTYDDDHLPLNGSLDKRSMQNWLKILRNNIGSFRYFGCGEYGNFGNRPHYHICLFGYDFPDKKLVTRHLGNPQYESQLLRNIWHKGHVSVGDLSFASAAYIARYCFKKQFKKEGVTPCCRQPEYILMSNRPGIGAGYVDRYASDLVSAKSVVYGLGQKAKIPKYYEGRLSPDDLQTIKAARLEHQLLESPLRTSQRELSAAMRLQSYKRSFEDETN